MKTIVNNSAGKRVYLSPRLERIKLDNEISLQLESSPTAGDGDDEVMNYPRNFENDPYKKALV